MTGQVRVLGASAAAGRLRAELDGWVTEGTDVTVMASWRGTADLERAARGDGVLLHVETPGLGRVAIGPALGGGGCCFDCYAARRRANGGGACRPATAITDAAREVVCGAVKRLSSTPDHFLDRQLEVTARGEARWHWCPPVPGCPADDRPERARRPVDPHDVIGERTGVVNRLETLPGAPRGWSAVRAVGCRTDALGLVRAVNSGIALDGDGANARLRAVGEAVERYSPAFEPTRFRWGTAADLPDHHLPFGVLPGTRVEASARDPSRWVRARRLRDDAAVWVPASAVHVPYTFAGGEQRVEVLSSTGLAAHTSYAAAVEHGLAEVIERDAFMRAWRSHQGVAPLNCRPCDVTRHRDDSALHIAEIAGPHGWHVVVASYESDRPPLASMGLAARRTRDAAVAAASAEALAGRVWLCEWLRAGPPAPPAVPRTLADHARLHAVERALAGDRRAWLDGTAERVGCAARESPETSEACVVDLTTTDVAAAGWHVVRVLVPGHVPLDDDAAHPLLAGDPTPHPLA